MIPSVGMIIAADFERIGVDMDRAAGAARECRTACSLGRRPPTCARRPAGRRRRSRSAPSASDWPRGRSRPRNCRAPRRRRWRGETSPRPACRTAPRTAAKAALARLVQPGPPTMAIGRSAAHSIFCSSAICVSPGQIGAATAFGASAASAVSSSMSSGKAITTGPGRPCMATWKARWTTSGICAALSISVAHLATEPKTAR